MNNNAKTAKIKGRLKLYTLLLREIENQEERLELLKRETPGGRLTEAKRARLEEELEKNLRAENAENKALEELLESVGEPDERAVIRLRYFDRLDWESVTSAIFGATAGFCDNPAKYKERVYKLHGHALLSLAFALEVKAVNGSKKQ